jgi:hypothetical protein
MMGVVYRALDPALGRTVALKTVHLAFSIPDAEREMFEKRFQAEARAAAGLSHPGIVVVHDVGRDPATGTLFIALEYLQGRTLAAVAPEGHPLEWREALRITARLAEALHHAHAEGIVHRDVKPANVMILPSGEPKLMDFGIAKVPASQLTSAGEFFGTPSYMSPEQAQGEAVDGRSDLFSLGAVLYQLLTGVRAFDAPNVPAILARVTQKDPPPPSAVAPQLPPDVDSIALRALAKKPQDRYPDGRTFAEDLDDVRSGRPPRHRAGWHPSERPEGTWVSVEPLVENETADLKGTGQPRRQATPEPQTGRLLRLTDRMGKRTFIALGAAAVLAIVAALLAPRPAPPAGGEGASSAVATTTKPSSGGLFRLPFAKEPAHLDIVFEHSLKGGTLKVWIDDDLAFEEALQSRVVKKILSVRIRKGTFRKTLDLPAGEHVIKVQVEGDGYSGSSRIRGSFESGEKRRLEINKGSLPLLKQELELEWS